MFFLIIRVLITRLLRRNGAAAGKPQLNFHCLVASQPSSPRNQLLLLSKSNPSSPSSSSLSLLSAFPPQPLNQYSEARQMKLIWRQIIGLWSSVPFLDLISLQWPPLCGHSITPLLHHSKSHSKVSEFSTNPILQQKAFVKKAANLLAKYQAIPPTWLDSLVSCDISWLL